MEINVPLTELDTLVLLSICASVSLLMALDYLFPRCSHCHKRTFRLNTRRVEVASFIYGVIGERTVCKKDDYISEA